MRDQVLRPESVPRYDTCHPEYEDWLRETNMPREDTEVLMCALVRAPMRLAMFERWHRERCQAAPGYTDDIDGKLLGVIAAEIGERIDRVGRSR